MRNTMIRYALVLLCCGLFAACGSGNFGKSGLTNIPDSYGGPPKDLSTTPKDSAADDLSIADTEDADDATIPGDTTPSDTSPGDVAGDTAPTPDQVTLDIVPWTLSANTSLLVVVGSDKAADLGLYQVAENDAITKLSEFNVSDGFTLVAGVQGRPQVIVGDATNNKIKLIELTEGGTAYLLHDTESIGAGLVDLVVSPQSDRVLVLTDNPPTLTSYKLDTSARTLTKENSVTVAVKPKRIGLLSDGKTAWITGNTSDELTTVTIDNSGVKDANQDVTTNPGPFGIAVAPSGSVVLVVDHDNRTITPFANSNGLLSPYVSGMISLGTDPLEVVITPDSQLALVTDGTAETKNLQVLQVVGTNLIDNGLKDVGKSAGRLVVRSNGKLALVVNTTLNQVTPLTISGLTVTVSTPVSVVPAPTDLTIIEF